ncbi:MAG: hypothetical protein ACYCS1_04410 [Gammaproteobacteria bacterium]
MTTELQLQPERKRAFNYSDKKVTYNNLRVLSQIETIRLKVIRKECPTGHTIDIIKLFSLDEKLCYLDNNELKKDILTVYEMEVYSFIAESEKGEKYNIFINGKNTLDLSIYQKITISDGYEISVSTRNKDIFKKGILVLNKEQIRPYEELKTSQKLLIDKDEMLKQFLPDMLRFKGYSEIQLAVYKKALVLPIVQTGINCLVVGEPGLSKTIFGYKIAEISGGAYGDLINTSKAGLIGTVLKNITGSYSFIAGKIFDAKNKVLVLDEIYTGGDKQYLNVLNNILANHTFTFSKAGVQFSDDKFYMSLLALCNPIGQNKHFNGVPINDINKMFSGDFLSRMHLIIPLKDKGREHHSLVFNSEKSSDDNIKLYLQQAKQIKLKEPAPEVTLQMRQFVEDLYPSYNNARFPKNFSDICQATAKLNLHHEIKMSDFTEAKEIFNVTNQMLYAD